MKIVVLISGRGSNLKSLINNDISPAKIIAVGSDVFATGLDHARDNNIPTFVTPKESYHSRKDFDEELSNNLKVYNPDLIVLAGFMRVLGPEFCNEWSGKIINIHPSILPNFKGLNTHQRVIEAGAKKHGCTVHYVIAELDNGPIIDQAFVDVYEDDTPDVLAARVLEREHTLLPKCVKELANNK